MPSVVGSEMWLRYWHDSMAKGAKILEMLRDPEVVKPANPANEHIILEDET